MARIVFIGAGSAVFTRNLVADLITFPELADTEVVLMDVDEERLDRITRITEYVIKQENARLTVRSTLSRREALRGADYVVITIAVGGLEARGRTSPSPPVWRRPVHRRHPGARWHLPRAAASGRVRQHRSTTSWSSARRSGAAVLQPHGHPHLAGASFAGPHGRPVPQCPRHFRPTGATTAESPSTNWTTGSPGSTIRPGSYSSGTGARTSFPPLRPSWQTDDLYGDEPVRIELFRRFGYFVTESSAHASEYYPYFRKTPEMIDAWGKLYQPPGSQYGGGSTGGGITKAKQRELEYEEMMQRQSSGQEQFVVRRSGEYGAEIVAAVESGSCIRINGNVRNDGHITNLPRGVLRRGPLPGRRASGFIPASSGTSPRSWRRSSGPASGCRRWSYAATWPRTGRPSIKPWRSTP